MRLGGIIANKYQLLEVIDKTKKYVIFKAINIGNEEELVLKIVKKSYLRDSKKIDNLIKEIQNMALLHHQAITKILDVDYHSGTFYIAQEYVENATQIDDFFSKKQLIPITKTIYIIKKLCYLLDFAYKKGIKYRTIKISNILLKKDFDVKILGFNFPSYYEIFERKKILPNPGIDSDILFLGILLFSLVEGKFPLKKNDINVSDWRLWKYLEFDTNFKITNPNISSKLKEKLENLTYKCVTRDIDDRINDYYEFLKYIGIIAEDLNQGVKVVTAKEIINEITPEGEEFWRNLDNESQNATISAKLSIIYAFVTIMLMMVIYWLI